ncbi:hypothetical protein [Mastigocoleus testarum]|uniref:Uncharacterized protein n=1 Tax=Mastigocoleus testarum BC008 TaxID=371196 RepID=A0A0V7ZUV6_9CYAN|nr:hypothetical protein [Mastigocoleus testarum]KST68235.1 hypothetical protein BC008_00295 [Mastigocoleus testarum BC008]
MTNQNYFENLISEELTAEDQVNISGGASFIFNDEIIKFKKSSIGEVEVEISNTETNNNYSYTYSY